MNDLQIGREYFVSVECDRYKRLSKEDHEFIGYLYGTVNDARLKYIGDDIFEDTEYPYCTLKFPVSSLVITEITSATSYLIEQKKKYERELNDIKKYLYDSSHNYMTDFECNLKSLEDIKRKKICYNTYWISLNI